MNAADEISKPIFDFASNKMLDDLTSATSSYLDDMLPSTKDLPSPISAGEVDSYPIFLTDRSLSLWSQLAAPPPLQPPNWIRSRIRRLFLVSLGVPVDLDQILPASKQKKLILPSTGLRRDSRSSLEGGRPSSRVRLKRDNASPASIDQPSSHRTSRRRRGPSPPPELDLGAVRVVCLTSQATLESLADHELQVHIRQLEAFTAQASQVLAYWLRRKDNALGDREAFEGVIENLVRHARRIRK